MNLEFLCPHCRTENRAGTLPAEDFRCANCGQSVALRLSAESQAAGMVDRCAVCGTSGLYLQKDFNPRLGILIFAIGVLFSYHTKFLSLFIATAIDFVLYYALPTVTVCYQCRAIYRACKENPRHQGFNHVTALKYSKTAT